jgi:hypothetical protein
MKNYSKRDQHVVVYTAISDTRIEYSWVIWTIIPSLVNKFYIFIVTTFKLAPYKGTLSDMYRQFFKKYQISNIGYMTHPMVLMSIFLPLIFRGFVLKLSAFQALILCVNPFRSSIVRQYDFPVPLQCRKTSDAVFIAFLRPLSEPVRRFSSCSTDFSQQIARVLLFLFLYVFLF